MVDCGPPKKQKMHTPLPTDVFVCPFTVAVDTREQAPWYFKGIIYNKFAWVIPRENRTLQTGDYSIVGHERKIAIERKSAADLVGSISSGNERFRAEHERMRDMMYAAAATEAAGGPPAFCCVIIEDSLSTICEELDADEGRRVTGSMVLGAAASWPQRFGVPWYFAGDRRHAELLAFRILLKWWENGQVAT